MNLPIRKAYNVLRSNPKSFFKLAKNKLRILTPIDYHMLRNGYSLPAIAVTIELVHTCNLRCKMCDLYSLDAGGSLESNRDLLRAENYTKDEACQLEDWKKVIDKLTSKPVINITGGEPFLFGPIIELCRYIKDRGFVLTITTNGTLIKRFIPDLVKTGVDNITISIDGDEKMHDDIRGIKGAFQKSIGNLRALEEEKKKQGVRLPSLQINMTTSPFNHHRLSEIMESIENEKLPLDKLVLSHLWYWDKKIIEDHNKKHSQWNSYVVQNIDGMDKMRGSVVAEEIRKIKQMHLSFPIKFFPNLSGEDIIKYYEDSLYQVKGKCKYTWMNMRVLPDGKAISCLNYETGNLKQQELKDVWNGEKYRKFRKQIKKEKNQIFSACNRCCGLFNY